MKTDVLFNYVLCSLLVQCFYLNAWHVRFLQIVDDRAYHKLILNWSPTIKRFAKCCIG